MITKKLDKQKVHDVTTLIENAQQISIVTHISPDGDAMGSSLGLCQFLLSQGKKVTVIVPNRFADFLAWMPSTDSILVYDEMKEQTEAVLNSSDLLFALDFNTLTRIGALNKVVKELACNKILIDHHRDPDDFCQLVLSYPKIASTSELVFRLIYAMGFFPQMTLSCAECLYSGMMTDTGAFSFNSNDPEVYLIIHELLKKGVDKDAIYSKVYNNYSVDRMRFMGYVLSEKMEIFPEYHTAIVALSKAELARFNYKEGDTEGFVNIPLSIKGIVFSVFIKESKDMVKLSFRSRGSFPVNKLAAALFNGGGHINASGGESYKSLEDTVKKLKAALPSYKKELEES
jgi:bifunctional oligoribonuclease and PAP phosphatase NrnA